MVLVEPLHGLTFALLLRACMQILFVIIPRALAATAQAIYGAVAVGAMSAFLSLVSGPLYGAFGARVLGHGAALCGCVADRVCDAQGVDQCIRVESNPTDTSVVASLPSVPGTAATAQPMHTTRWRFHMSPGRPLATVPPTR
jgi:hypothetical protein